MPPHESIKAYHISLLAFNIVSCAYLKVQIKLNSKLLFIGYYIANGACVLLMMSQHVKKWH